MKKVLVRAPALSMSGYGEQARFVLAALMSRPDLYEVFIEDVNWGKTGSVTSNSPLVNWIRQRILLNRQYAKFSKENRTQLSYDLSIQITIPNEWQKLAPVNIGHTAGIECDRVTPQWVELGNHMDKIITISQHSKMVYESSAFEIHNHSKESTTRLELNTPISYVGYNTRCIGEAQEEFELNLETKFNFLSVSQLGPRKNTLNMLRWFIKEFHDDADVGLVLKTHYMNCSHLDSIETKNILNAEISKHPEKKCKVYLLHGEMSEKEMCSLYRHPDIKSYLTFTHGEGFGLPIFEAVCNGLPVIAPNWSGHIDFLYAKQKKKGKEAIKPLFCKVPFILKPVQKEAIYKGLIEKESRWCFVEEMEAKQSMRKVRKNYSMYLSWAKKLQEHVLNNFSKEKQYQKLIEEIESTGQQSDVDVGVVVL